MEKIGIPIKIALQDASTVSVAASADCFVSLDTDAKGIHMSRLYLKLNEILANQTINAESLNRLIDTMLSSHKETSHQAQVKLSFALPLYKKALLSDNAGYQNYNISLTHKFEQGHAKTQLELEIPYSSTCPCSASLARQLVTDAIAEKFQDDSISKEELINWFTSTQTSLATPHNQRSYAYIKMDFNDTQWEALDELIFTIESVLGTPVQTAVKREDEQEFARLNGANLMFCEDAARKLKGYLEAQSNLTNYWFKIEHQESLHEHNAVVIDHK